MGVKGNSDNVTEYDVFFRSSLLRIRVIAVESFYAPFFRHPYIIFTIISWFIVNINSGV